MRLIPCWCMQRHTQTQGHICWSSDAETFGTANEAMGGVRGSHVKQASSWMPRLHWITCWRGKMSTLTW